MTTTPRISINKLVEYCLANGPRRTAIIEDILQPKGYLVDTGYNDIERAFAAYLSTQGEDSTKLRDLDYQLQQREARTDHEEGRILNALDMIECALTLPLEKFEKLNIESPASKMPRFELSGLSVSVGPTNILRLNQRGKKAQGIGIIKSYFSMTAPLTTTRSSEKAALHGTILHWYAETFLAHLGEIIPSVCFSIDVFAQKVTSAPKSYKARRRHIASCAQEICDRWKPIKSRLVENGKIAIAGER